MKLYFFSTVASAAVAAPALVAATGSPSVVYLFEPEHAGGISGSIKTTWADKDGTDVTIDADLSFEGVDASALALVDGGCDDQPQQFLWSIHTQWNSDHSFAAYGECGDDLTGEGYDAKTFGLLTPDEDGSLQKTWTETAFASWDGEQPTWSIVVQAVCGKASPTVACASGIKPVAKRKHLRVAKRHAVKDAADMDGNTGEGDVEEEYIDDRKHKHAAHKAKRHAVKDAADMDGNTGEGDVEEENIDDRKHRRHAGNVKSSEQKAVNVKVVVHHKK